MHTDVTKRVPNIEMQMMHATHEIPLLCRILLYFILQFNFITTLRSIATYMYL